MAKQKFNLSIPKMQPKTSEVESKTVEEEKSVPALVNKLNSSDKNPFDIKFIPRSRLRNNKKNIYPIVEIEELATSILNYDLLQNPNAVYSPEEDVYIIEAGHRRATALDLLIDRYSNYDGEPTPEYELYKKNVQPYEKGYPCKVKFLEDGIIYDSDADLASLPESVIDSEIRLYITNEEVRPKDPVRTAQVVERLNQLYQAKNKGKTAAEKINVKKTIAEELKISDRQVVTYNAVNNKLIPELKTLFENKNINLTDAEAYTKLTEEEQLQVYNIIMENEKISSKEVKALMDSNRKLQEEISRKEEMLRAAADSKDEVRRLKKEIEELKSKPVAKPVNEDLVKLRDAYDSLIMKGQQFLKLAEKNSELLDGDDAALQEVIKLLKIIGKVKDDVKSFD